MIFIYSNKKQEVTSMMFSIADHFSIIQDPRQQSKIEYELLDVIFLCVVGMICGAEA